jgi:fructokinase
MIYTLGESLLDIIIADNGKTTAKPGGAMLNAAVSLARSNCEVSLITETGDDLTAKYIIDFLKNNGIYTSYITKYKNIKTSLALAYLDKNKNASYSFYKQYPDKRSLKIPKSFSRNDILLFGSIYATDRIISHYIKNIVDKFSASGGLLIYDPNIRQSDKLKDKNRKDSVYKYLAKADIIKGSNEDFSNIFDTNNIENQLEHLHKINPKALIIITRGEKGAIGMLNNLRAGEQAFEINPVSTIGAGDAFSAGIIYYLYKNDIGTNSLKKLTGDNIKIILKTGIDFATKVCLSDENYI